MTRTTNCPIKRQGCRGINSTQGVTDNQLPGNISAGCEECSDKGRVVVALISEKMRERVDRGDITTAKKLSRLATRIEEALESHE